MRRVSRGAVFWGSALVTAGLVILAIQQGLVDEAVFNDIGQWWPLLLIGAGLAIVFAGVLGVVAVALSGVLLGLLVGGLVSGPANFGVGCTTEAAGSLVAYQEGSFSGSAPDVQIDLNCVTLEVTGDDGDGWSVESDEAGTEGLELAADGARLELRNQEDMSVVNGHRSHLAVTVPRDAAASVGTSINAGEADFDLSDGQWSQIDLTGNAMALTIDLSGAEAADVSISMNAGSAKLQLSDESDIGSPLALGANAGSFEVCAPDDLGLAITISQNVAVGHNLDERGLEQDGDVWRTDGYASADRQVEITFTGNAASFTLNPEGGCS
jgi:hypothetical protein